MKYLVIVESPAKSKTIEKYLGKDYTVLASYGHVRDLAKAGLGIDIDNQFNPHYEVMPDKEDVVKKLPTINQFVGLKRGSSSSDFHFRL